MSETGDVPTERALTREKLVRELEAELEKPLLPASDWKERALAKIEHARKPNRLEKIAVIRGRIRSQKIGAAGDHFRKRFEQIESEKRQIKAGLNETLRRHGIAVIND